MEKHMKTKILRRHTTIIFTFVVLSMIILMAGVFTSLQLTQQNQDVRSDAAAGPVVFNVGIDSERLASNQEKTVPIVVNTNGLSLSAAVIALKINPAVVTITKMEAGDKLSVVLQQAVIDQTAGTVKITLGAPPNQAFSGTGTVAMLTIKGKDVTGLSKIEFDGAQLQAAALNNQANVGQPGTIGGVSVGNVPAGEISISAPTCGTNYKVGAPITFTGTTTAGTMTQSMLFISKPTPDGKDLVNFINGGCPAGEPQGNAETKMFCRVVTGTTSPVTFTYTPTDQQKGKFIALMNSIDTTHGVQCSGNPKCSFSTDSPYNKYAPGSCNAFVDCSLKDVVAFEVVSADNCPAPPTAPPTTPPTAPPTAPPTTPPGPVASGSAQVSFKLQGLKKADINIPTEFILKFKMPGETAYQTANFSQTIKSGAEGRLISAPIALNNVNLVAIGGSLDGVEIYAKTAYSLNKKLGTVKLLANQTVELSTTIELMVGDFNQQGSEKNLFNILDISQMQGAYLALTNALTDTNRQFDVNYDGTYDILDLSLVIGNFQKLELPGDLP